jgi:ATP-dependent exoDNAse (exonuclease V) beta subunit
MFQNKIFEYPLQFIINEFGFDPVSKEYNITKKHVDKFYNDVHDKLIPIRTEFIVYDRQSLIGGMLDMLFYNIKVKEFQIWDWKTNKKFTKENKSQHLLNELCMLEDCDLELYSLQLELYKQIIERNTNIKLGKSYLVWFSHNNDSYEIIETKNRKYYIDIIINNRIAEILT